MKYKAADIGPTSMLKTATLEYPEKVLLFKY